MVLTGGFMTLLDVSSVNVALPSIQETLGATPSEIQWIVAGYGLTFGLMLVPAGRFGDAIGRRRMFLIGLIGFVLLALGSGLAPTATALALFRLAQGAFAGIMNPQIAALIQELFRGRDRARAFGMFGMVLSVSTAIGPVLGGVLVTTIASDESWRAVFLINVPIGVVLIPLAARFLPSPAARSDVQRVGLDIPGLLLIAGIVLSVMWPFVTASSSPEGLAGAPLWLLAIAVVLGIALAAWERRQNRHSKPAVLPAVLMRNAGFVLGTTLAFALFAGFTSIFLIVTMFYQDGLGHSALVAGLVQLPMAITSAWGSHWAGARVMDRGRRIVIEGLAIMIISAAVMAVATVSLDVEIVQWLIPVLMAVSGWGSACVITPNHTLTLNEVPTPLAGTAAGLLQTSQRLGGVIGLTLVSTVYFAGVVSGGGSLSGYTNAFALSLTLNAALIAIALVIAVVDARRRANRRAAGSTE